VLGPNTVAAISFFLFEIAEPSPTAGVEAGVWMRAYRTSCDNANQTRRMIAVSGRVTAFRRHRLPDRQSRV
jgi:hypothetical protein